MIITQKNSSLYFSINGNKFFGTVLNNEATGSWSAFQLFSSVDYSGEFKMTIVVNNTLKIQWRDTVITNWVTEPLATKVNI